MAIGAPPTGLSLVSIASLFFVLVCVHALTLFLDSLANFLGLFICPWLFVVGAPLTGFLQICMLRAANSCVNLFSVLRPSSLFYALILFVLLASFLVFHLFVASRV